MPQTKHLRLLALLLGIIIVGILGYGYWHTATHSTLEINIRIDPSDTKAALQSPTIITFKGQDGNDVATGEIAPETARVYLIHPGHQHCTALFKKSLLSKEEKALWHDCFREYSLWIPTWISHVSTIAIESGSCLQSNIPFVVHEHTNSWWFWWVPMRHIGGKPYTYYFSEININQEETPELLRCLTARD